MDKIAIALLGLFAATAAQAQTLPQLPTATTPLTGSELMYVVQGGVSKQVPSGSLPFNISALLNQSVNLGTGSLTANGGINTTGGGSLAGTFTGSPTFSGNLSLTGSGTALAVTNNATIGGTLGVTGAATFGSGSANILTITPGASSSSATTFALSGTGALQFTNGKLTMNSVPAFTFGGGTITLSGGSSSTPFSENFNLAGSSTATQDYIHTITLTGDTLQDIDGQGGIGVLRLNEKMQSGATGSRMPFWILLNDGSALSQGGFNEQDAGVTSQVEMAYNHGGTDTEDGAIGSLNGLNTYVTLTGSATDFQLVNAWGEGDMSVCAACSVKNEVFQSNVLLSSHRTAGAQENYGWVLGAQVGATPTVERALVVGGIGGAWPMASTGYLLSTDYETVCGGADKTCQFPPQLATGGVYLPLANFTQQSGYGLLTPGFSVSGNGTTNIGGATLTPTSSGLTIGTTNYIVQGTPTIVSAGSAPGDSTNLNNYWPSDIVYGPGNVVMGQYEVTSTKAIAGSVAAGGSGGANGSCTVTDASGNGATSFQLSGTVTGGVLAGALTVATAGSYTSTDPFGATAAAVPVTGCSLTGATVYVGMGVAGISVLVADVNSTSLSGTQSTTGGSGSGLTLSMSSSQGSLLTVGTGAEALKAGSSGEWTANASVATALSSIGPTGSHTTVQEWFTVTDSAGTVRYIPAF